MRVICSFHRRKSEISSPCSEVYNPALRANYGHIARANVEDERQWQLKAISSSEERIKFSRRIIISPAPLRQVMSIIAGMAHL